MKVSITITEERTEPLPPFHQLQQPKTSLHEVLNISDAEMGRHTLAGFLRAVADGLEAVAR
jgi:hypothetical protein